MGWFGNDPSKKQDKDAIQDVVSGLQKLYAKNLRPLEDAYKFHEFHSPPLDDADFHAKPMVLHVQRKNVQPRGAWNLMENIVSKM